MDSAPQKGRLLRSHSKRTRESLDQTSNPSSSGAPHEKLQEIEPKEKPKATKEEFEALARDLELSKTQADIVGAFFVRWNMLDPNYKFAK